MKPKELSIHPESWLSVIGPVLCVSILVWFFMTPELFLLQLPLLLIALLMTAIGGMYVLDSPPSWLWIGLIVVAFCMMDFSIRRGGVEAGGFDAQSVLKGLIWLVVAAFGIYHGRKNLFSSFPLAAFFIYTLFAMGSALYSPSIGLALGSGIALIGLSTYAGVIAGWPRERVQQLWHVLFMSIFVIAVVSVILSFVFPDWARDYLSGSGRLRGVTGSPQSLGAILSIGCIAGHYCISSIRATPKKIIYLLMVCFLLVALVMTNSRSSMIGLVSSYVLMAMFSSIPGLIAGSIFASLIAWLIYQPALIQDILRVFADLGTRSGRVAEITTFTGRNDIWAAVYHKWLEQPWFGYGLASPRVVISQAWASRWGDVHESAHNAMLESLLSFGAFGTALLALFIISLIVGLLKLKSHLKTIGPKENDDANLVLLMTRCVFMLLVYGLMEKAYAGTPSPATILFAMVVGSYAALARDGFREGMVGGAAIRAAGLRAAPLHTVC